MRSLLATALTMPHLVPQPQRLSGQLRHAVSQRSLCANVLANAHVALVDRLPVCQRLISQARALRLDCSERVAWWAAAQRHSEKREQHEK